MLNKQILLLLVVFILIGVYLRVFKSKKRLTKGGKKSAKKNLSKYEKIHAQIHREMLEDMQLDDFEATTGLSSLEFLELRNLYSEYISNGKNPAHITAKDYQRVLDN